MAKMRLETENVRIILMNQLNSMELYGMDSKEAEQQMSYIAGMVDMANAVIQAIEDLGGR